MRNKEEDTICGKLSNIPDCCIRFFNTNFWNWMVINGYSLIYFQIDAMITKQNAWYVRCPKCILLRKKNDIKICKEWCGKIPCGKFPETLDND